MNYRTPLPENYPLRMENGGAYIIRRKIAEGGFSLVYEAETPGGTAPVVIKEYFPAEGAYRNEQYTVCPLVHYEESFARNLAQFQSEGTAGGAIARRSFQTVSFQSCGNGYALMQEESTDMVSIADLVARWAEDPPVPFTGNKADADPVFTDLVRLKYSLRIVESLLSVLSTVHKSGYLHLDVSSRNSIWAGADQDTGRNCAAFIADFGCSVPLRGGVYQPGYQLSYSPGFAAPEVQRGLHQLTPATDLYSVGMLLFFLCVGDTALEITRNRKRQVLREAGYLKLPQRIKDRLVEIICTAVGEQSDRYQSAEEMQAVIRQLNELIPTHPINPDNTLSFTLRSLRSMLEGSLDSRYSWAHELSDRRNVMLPSIPEEVFEPLTWRTYTGDMDFLQWVLPKYLFGFLKEKIEAQPDRQAALSGIMSGNYPRDWKAAICYLISRRGTGDLLIASRTALNNESGFSIHRELLFRILGEEGQRLQDCYYQPGERIRNAPYIGLAMFTLYALLGPDGFAELIPSPSKDGGKLFYPV